MASPPRVDSVDYDEIVDELITGEAVALDLRPAGFVLRAAGSAIDYVLYMGTYIIGVIVLLVPAMIAAGVDEALTAAIEVAAGVVLLLIVPVTVEVLSHGRSLGKLAVGVRIVRDDGGAISLRHAATRGILAVIEIYLPTGIALLVGLLNARAKRLGDLAAGTYAQHERIPHIQMAIYGVPLELLEWSKTADVARMPDALARRIAQYLAQAHGLSLDSRSRLGRQLAHEASIYVSPLPDADAELFLAAVASLRRDREFAALQLEKRRLEQLRPVLTGLPHRFPERDA